MKNGCTAHGDDNIPRPTSWAGEAEHTASQLLKKNTNLHDWNEKKHLSFPKTWTPWAVSQTKAWQALVFVNKFMQMFALV